jgi:hypothetical protein
MAIGQKISVLLHLAAIAICIYGGLSGRPPVEAQESPQPNYQQMSPFDAVQNSDIMSINKHLEHTDSTIDRLSDEIVSVQREQSSMQGAQNVWFWLVGLLVTGALGVTTLVYVKGKKL